jgi:methyl-accepting chemotaxis protein
MPKELTMLAKLSIRAKLVAVVSLLLISLATMGGFGLLQMRSQNAYLLDIQTSWLPSVQTLGDLRASTITYRVVVRDLVALSDPEARARTEKTLETVTQSIDKVRKTYEPLISSEEERNVYKEFSEAWSSYTAEARSIITMAAKGQNNEAREINANKVNPIGLKADAALRKDIELNNKGATDAAVAAAQDYSRAFWMVLGALGLLTLLGIASAIYLIGDISRGIASIVAPMRSLGEGDLSATVPHQGEKTEIGQMADALQVFKDALIAKKAADAAAAADAEAKIQRGHRVDTITRDFEVMIGEMVSSLSAASSQLEAAANTLTGTAESTQQQSASAASASRDVSDNVQSVAAASEEITSSVNEISRQVQESSRVAQSAVAQAQQTDTSIAELSKAAGRIGDVVKLITAVAEQTNLLALNATIEAARAGEAGRGFAVVASEVKALAAQTAKATEEISTQIEGMQSATDASVAAIREIGKTIGTISEISATIAAAVEEQGAATKEIARNMQEAARLSTQVASNVTDVNRGAGETGSASTQVLSSAQSLSTESGQLRLEVDKFLTAMRAA